MSHHVTILRAKGTRAPWQRSRSVNGDIAFLAAAAIWSGMIVGVSFLATPAKFLAPNLTLPAALDVGRHTFAIFNKVEWALSATTIVLLFVGRRSMIVWSTVILAMAIVVIETLWLLPILDSRVGLIIGGQQPTPSHHHTLYIICELAKLIAILLLVAHLARRIARRANQARRPYHG